MKELEQPQGVRRGAGGFETVSEVRAYFANIAKTGRALQLEMLTVADELQVLLANSTGSFFDKLAAKAKARLVSAQVRAAAAHSHAMAVEGEKLLRQFEEEYEDILGPARNSAVRKTLNWGQ